MRRPESSGFIYFVKPVSMAGPIKIGWSKNAETRLPLLMKVSPWPLEIAATGLGSMSMEQRIHALLDHARSHQEWFHPVPELTEAIAKIASGIPVDVAFDLARPTGRDRYDRAWRFKSKQHQHLS